jgi:hypothetical protein
MNSKGEAETGPLTFDGIENYFVAEGTGSPTGQLTVQAVVRVPGTCTRTKGSRNNNLLLLFLPWAACHAKICT